MTGVCGPYNLGGSATVSPRVAFPFLFVFFSKIVLCPSLRHVIFVLLGGAVQVMGKAEGEPARRSHGRGGRGGAGIKGRRTQGMSDAIIPALKHRIPSELRS